MLFSNTCLIQYCHPECSALGLYFFETSTLLLTSRHGRMAAARLCAQAWLSPHIIHINRGQRLIEIILSVRGRGQGGVIFFFAYFTFQAISRHFEIFFEKNRRTLLGDQLLCYSESRSSGRGQNAIKH